MPNFDCGLVVAESCVYLPSKEIPMTYIAVENLLVGDDEVVYAIFKDADDADFVAKQLNKQDELEHFEPHLV